MSNLIHVCLYNLEAKSSLELTNHITSLNFVRFVAEVGSADALAKLLHDSPVNLVFFHLDPDPKSVVEVIEQFSAKFPDLGLIAISHNRGPDAILAPMRAGCDQFVCEPIDNNDLTSAVSRVASRRMLSTTKSRCICVVGASGGVGATSIACNLALEIAQISQRDCALVDLDLQMGNVAVNFDCNPKYTIYDLASSGAELDRAVLTSTMTTLPEGVHLLTRPENMEQCDTVSPDAVERILEVLSEAYEHVVIDVPGHFEPQTAAVFARAEIILVVCQMLVPSIRNARRFCDALNRLGIAPDRIEVIVNRADGRSGRLTEKDVQETMRKPVFATIPNDFQFVARSIDVGKPISSLDQNNAVRAAIRKIAKKVMTATTAAGNAANKAKQPEQKRGLIGRLLSR
jgi:pilus assembly protein CpaE